MHYAHTRGARDNPNQTSSRNAKCVNVAMEFQATSSLACCLRSLQSAVEYTLEAKQNRAIAALVAPLKHAHPQPINIAEPCRMQLLGAYKGLILQPSYDPFISVHRTLHRTATRRKPRIKRLVYRSSPNTFTLSGNTSPTLLELSRGWFLGLRVSRRLPFLVQEGNCHRQVVVRDLLEDRDELLGNVLSPLSNVARECRTPRQQHHHDYQRQHTGTCGLEIRTCMEGHTWYIPSTRQYSVFERDL